MFRSFVTAPANDRVASASTMITAPHLLGSGNVLPSQSTYLGHLAFPLSLQHQGAIHAETGAAPSTPAMMRSYERYTRKAPHNTGFPVSHTLELYAK